MRRGASPLGNQAAQRFALLQRQTTTFTGGPGKTAAEKDRPLIGYAGPLPETLHPGGTVIPKTAGTEQNCAGDSCNIKQYINWPYLGIEILGLSPQRGAEGDWTKATNFVPTACTAVGCGGVDVNNTRCRSGDAKKKINPELELIVFLYRWPGKWKVIDSLTGLSKEVTGTQSDFHMIGRDAVGLPKGWHSKMDRRQKVADIRDPWQSLHDAYPHTQQKDREVKQLCFCCDQAAIKTT